MKMKLLSFAVISVLCMMTQATMFSTIATVSMALVSLNQPVNGFFGIFRRRQSPVLETAAAPESRPPFGFNRQQPMTGGFMRPSFGASNMFSPSFNTPSFGMFGQNRFPPQFNSPQQMPPHMQMPQRQQMKPPQQSRPQDQMPAQHFTPQQSQMLQSQGSVPESDFNMDNFEGTEGEDGPPGMNTEEAESFFALLAETDESKCISRLVCEMGARPEAGGEFGSTIADIVGSLTDFPKGSNVAHYNDILNTGVREGLSACLTQFSLCDEESYQLVKKAQDGEEQNA